MDTTVPSSKQNSSSKSANDIFGAIVSNLPDVVYLLDADGRFRYINKAVERWGYTQEEMVGANFLAFIHPDDHNTSIECFNKKQSGENYLTTFELRLKTKHDGYRYFKISSTGFERFETCDLEKLGLNYSDGQKESGHFSGIVGSIHDITERKQIEESLIFSENKYRTVIEKTTDGIAILQSNIITFVNQTMLDIIESDEASVIGKKLTDFIAPESLPTVTENYRKRIQGEEAPSIYEATVIKPNGERLQTELNVNLIYIDDEPAVIVMVRDITARIKEQADFRASEEKFRNLFETMAQGVIYRNENGDIISANQFAIIMNSLKLVDGKYVRKEGTKFFSESGKELTSEEMPYVQALKTGKPVYNQVVGILSPGSEKCNWHLVNSMPQYLNDKENPTQVYSTIEDITSRRQNELFQKVMTEILVAASRIDNISELLAEVHSSLNALIEAPGLVLCEQLQSSADIRYPYWADDNIDVNNESNLNVAKEISRYIINHTHPVLLSGDYLHKILEDKGIKKEDITCTSVLGVPLHRGDEIFGTLEVKSYCPDIVYSIDDLNQLSIISDNISQILSRKAAEESTRIARISLNSVFEAILWFDMDGNIISVNDIACEELGYSRKELLSMRIVDILPDPDGNCMQEIWPVRSAKIKELKSLRFESEFVKKNGDTFPIAVSSSYAIVDEQECIIGIAQNITEKKLALEEKKSLENQLYHAQKMESIGRLAGGIAHDFNNILAGVMGYSELLQMKFPDEATMEGKSIGIILNGARKAAELTKQLLSFARKEELKTSVVRLNSIIREVINVYERIFEKNIAVHVNFDANLKKIAADKSQLDQVFTNLVINAKDAMPDGGELFIKTENITLSEEESFQYSNLKTGEYIKASIRDTGTGIPENLLLNIFEPFFTTKEEGKGTGLGLSIVYGIITKHGGDIVVDSVINEGTTFSIFLPVTEEELELQKVNEEIKGGSATILIVDDEQNVRTMNQALLESIGYTVITAEDGQQALNIFEVADQKIDLVMLDIIMPGISAAETFGRLKKMDPDLKILLVSGYSKEEKAQELIQKGANGFLQKPFLLADISKAITRIIE